MSKKRNVSRGSGGILVRIFTLIALMVAFSLLRAGVRAGKKWPVVSEHLPKGFTVSYGPEYYGTEEEQRENGSLYDYINGGGEVYIEHGFREVMHVVLADRKGNELTLDIFDMGTPANAAAAFADEAICAKGHAGGNRGPNWKEYRYSPDYILFFIRDRYLVSFSLNNDRLEDIAGGLADAVFKAIQPNRGTIKK